MKNKAIKDEKCATIYRTMNYEKFTFSIENRDVNLTKIEARKLRESMKKYGWLISFPASCIVDNGKLKVQDGQHRITIAKQLGIGIVYVIEPKNYDVADTNTAQAGWKPVDYMKRWQKAGIKDYHEIEEMRKTFKFMPFGACVSFLMGHYHYSHVRGKFENGLFRVKSKGLAYRIAITYKKMITANSDCKGTNNLKALYACYLVEAFDDDRLIEKAEKFPHLLQNFARRDDYLEMYEEIYNHAVRSGRIPLKFLALEAIKKRSEEEESKVKI